MKPPIRLISEILGAAIIAMTLGGPPAVRAAVPADITEQLRKTAITWQMSVQRQREMRRLTGDSASTLLASEINRRVYSSLMAQAVMEAITRNPASARDVTRAAISVAPELKAGILSNLSTAFPGMASTFNGSNQLVRPIEVVTAGAPRAPPVKQRKTEADKVVAEINRNAADHDPLERFNRAMFAVNDFLDQYILVPIAKGYRFIMPKTLREKGRNFFRNLNEPVIAINDLLQADLENAGVSVGRFFVNSTIGLFGFFEVAERIDLKEHSADFGQTLHTYGFGSGPFIMLPFFGPSTLRDTVGGGVDSFFNPFGYLLDSETRMYLKASEIVVKREVFLDPLNELRKGSVDYYTAVRSAWQQSRAKELRKGAAPALENLDALFKNRN